MMSILIFELFPDFVCIMHFVFHMFLQGIPSLAVQTNIAGFTVNFIFELQRKNVLNKMKKHTLHLSTATSKVIKFKKSMKSNFRYLPVAHLTLQGAFLFLDFSKPLK